MSKSKLILITAITPLLLWFSLPVLAQQNSSSLSKVASDLALDLQFAQKNPAPESEIINQNESKEAVITTSTEHYTVKPEELLVAEIKTQIADQTTHPEQSTSEQVIINRPGNQTPQDANPSSTSSGTLPPSNKDAGKIPGTTIVEPDDNSAPPSDQTLQPNSSPIDNSQTPIQNSTPTDTNQILPDDNSAAVQGVSTKASWFRKLIYQLFKK